MILLFRYVAAALLARCLNAQQIINGQIFTPGIAIVDAPQPNTPLGGDYLHIAIDVTSDGQLHLPPYSKNPISAINNITIFLSSYDTGKNFTITNGTSSDCSLGPVMSMEPGSTVKHINWLWPDCLAGDGAKGSDRGLYNISIRQNFRMNGSDLYTIFDLPIHVTNKIDSTTANGTTRCFCLDLNNPMLNSSVLNASANKFERIPGSPIQSKDGQGLGGAGMVDWRTSVHLIWFTAFMFFVAL